MARPRVLPFGTLEFLRARIAALERVLAGSMPNDEPPALWGEAIKRRLNYITIILNMAEDIARKPSGGKADDIELILSAVKYLKALNVNEGKQTAAAKRGDHQHEGTSGGAVQPAQRRISRASPGH